MEQWLGEAEAAYQAVSCGDKQSPEVIGVHAACLLLLPGRRHSRGGQAQSRQERPPHVHSGETGGPERPGKGGRCPERHEGREEAREPGDGTHDGRGGTGRGRGRTERRRRYFVFRTVVISHFSV